MPEWQEPPFDNAIARIALRQHGVVATGQLSALGLGDRAVRARAAVGRLHRIHRGVYAVGHSSLDQKGRWMAAVLASGSGALLSHRSAAAAHQLRPDNRPVIDVTSPRGNWRRLSGIARHGSRTLTSRDITVVDGTPCTSVARTLLDLAEVVDPQGLRRACEQAEVLRVFDRRELENVLARAAGRRGAPLLRSVLADGGLGDTTTRSELEEAFLALCRTAGVPTPRMNAWIPLEGGGIEADFLWPDVRLIAETDGAAFHATPAAFQRDRQRDQRALRAGYRVVRFTWWQVVHSPREVLVVLQALLAQSAASTSSAARSPERTAPSM